MRLPISEEYFDPLKHYDLVEEFMGESGVSGEVLQFATDMYGVETGIQDIINYYDLEEDFDNFILDNINNNA